MALAASVRGSRYEAALSKLRHEVVDGRFRDADMLPSERDLAQLLAVSRTTLRRVLATLADEAVLAQRQDVGTFVTRAPIGPLPRPAEASRLDGFAEDMRRRGHEPSSRDIERGLARPTAQEALVLACSPEASILRTLRLCYADGLPIALERSVVPSAFVGDMAAVGYSLASALADRGFTPVRSLDRVQAVLMDDGEAVRLDAAKGSPGLLVSRAAYLADGRCCLYTRALYRADRYDLLSERDAATARTSP